MCDECSKGINEQASYAATKLRQLRDKLEYKRHALESIQNAPKPDKKVTKDRLPRGLAYTTVFDLINASVGVTRSFFWVCR